MAVVAVEEGEGEEEVGIEEEGRSGERPDLLSSPEVFTCRKTFRGGRSEGTCLFSVDAVFVDVRV